MIIPLTLLAVDIGYVASTRADPVYQATGSILVGQPFQTSNPDKDYIEASQQLALTYADVISRQPVLEGVTRDLDLETSWEDLRDQVNVDLPFDNPQLIVVTVEADSPDLAKAIAGGIEDQVIALSPTGSQLQAAPEVKGFVTSQLQVLEDDIKRQQRQLTVLERALDSATTEEATRDLQRRIDNSQRAIIATQRAYSSLLNSFAGGQSPNYLQVLETAEAESDPIRPNIPLNTAIAGGVGFLIALGLAYLLEFRSRRRWDRRVQADSDDAPPKGAHSWSDAPQPEADNVSDRASERTELDRNPDQEDFGFLTPGEDERARAGTKGTADDGTFNESQ